MLLTGLANFQRALIGAAQLGHLARGGHYRSTGKTKTLVMTPTTLAQVRL